MCNYHYYYRSADPKPNITGHTRWASAATSAGPTKVGSLVLLRISSHLKDQTLMRVSMPGCISKDVQVVLVQECRMVQGASISFLA